MATRNYNSATSLLRVQYESLVRAIWVRDAASDKWIKNLAVIPTPDNIKQVNNIPMLSKMVKEMDGKVADVMLDQLKEFKEYLWQPLSSFIHSGVHSLSRQYTGWDEDLLKDLVKISNQLLLITGDLLVNLSDRENIPFPILDVQEEFMDCIKDLK